MPTVARTVIEGIAFAGCESCGLQPAGHPQRVQRISPGGSFTRRDISNVTKLQLKAEQISADLKNSGIGRIEEPEWAMNTYIMSPE